MNFQQRAAESNGQPVYDSEYAKWVRNYKWDYFITLSDHFGCKFGQHGKWATQEQGADFEKLVSTYVYRLGDRTFGREANRSIEFAAFFESKSKYGLHTAWHAHLLVTVPDDYQAKFITESARQWGKLTRRCIDRNGVDVEVTGSFEIQEIYDVTGAASYSAKFAEDERAPILMNLPATAAIVVKTPSN